MNSGIEKFEQFWLLLIIFTIVFKIYTTISRNFKSLFEGHNLKKYFFALELPKYCFSSMVDIYK